MPKMDHHVVSTCNEAPVRKALELDPPLPIVITIHIRRDAVLGGDNITVVLEHRASDRVYWILSRRSNKFGWSDSLMREPFLALTHLSLRREGTKMKLSDLVLPNMSFVWIRPTFTNTLVSWR